MLLCVVRGVVCLIYSVFGALVWSGVWFGLVRLDLELVGGLVDGQVGWLVRLGGWLGKSVVD